MLVCHSPCVEVRDCESLIQPYESWGLNSGHWTQVSFPLSDVASPIGHFFKLHLDFKVVWLRGKLQCSVLPSAPDLSVPLLLYSDGHN